MGWVKKKKRRQGTSCRKGWNQRDLKRLYLKRDREFDLGGLESQNRGLRNGPIRKNRVASLKKDDEARDSEEEMIVGEGSFPIMTGRRGNRTLKKH